MTNVNPYRKYATSPVATHLSMYNTGRLVTMMEVNHRWPTALERDSLALIPSYIALTEPTPSGRAQVHVKNIPSTSNNAHSTMEQSLAQQTKEYTATNEKNMCNVTPMGLIATTQTPYPVWPPDNHPDGPIPPKPNFSVAHSKVLQCDNIQLHRSGHMTIKWMPSLCMTHTQQHLIPLNTRPETNHPTKSLLQTQTTSSSWQLIRATWHNPRPSKNHKPWEHMRAFYLGGKLWRTDIKTTGKEGDSPLIETMWYLPPKTQWLADWCWSRAPALQTPAHLPREYQSASSLPVPLHWVWRSPWGWSHSRGEALWIPCSKHAQGTLLPKISNRLVFHWKQSLSNSFLWWHSSWILQLGYWFWEAVVLAVRAKRPCFKACWNAPTALQHNNCW